MTLASDKNSISLFVVCFLFLPTFVRATGRSEEATVEIKCLLSEEKAAEFSKKVDLNSKTPFTRVVCFFDTPLLSLFQHEPKLILRSRYDSTGERDTTVKIRGGEGKATVDECEYDEVLGKEKIMSCSITSKNQKRSALKDAAAGENIRSIFSKHQRTALEERLGEIDWRALKPFGPVKDIEVWKNIKISAKFKLTVERWHIPAHSREPAQTLFEVSAKVPLSDEKSASKKIAELVDISPADSAQDSETKTKIVLEHFRAGTQ